MMIDQTSTMTALKTISIVALLALLLSGCGQGEQSTELAAANGEETIDLSDFYRFYQEFHRDSLYQIEHIIFPLEGLPQEVDSLTLSRGDFRWERETWTMHRPFDFQTSEFQRELIPMSESLVVERIVHQSGQFGMVRRFARIGDDWYLIYYAALNRLRGQTG